MEWDATRAVPQTIGGSIAPRTDTPEPDMHYVALQVDGQPFGRLQKFKDGSWGYWRFPLEQAKLAPSMEDAFKRLAVIQLPSASVWAGCPKCKDPMLPSSEDPAEEAAWMTAFTQGHPLKCKKCGTQVSTKRHHPPDPPRVD
jgi:hypothetical protein